MIQNKKVSRIKIYNKSITTTISDDLWEIIRKDMFDNKKSLMKLMRTIIEKHYNYSKRETKENESTQLDMLDTLNLLLSAIDNDILQETIEEYESKETSAGKAEFYDTWVFQLASRFNLTENETKSVLKNFIVNRLNDSYLSCQDILQTMFS